VLTRARVEGRESRRRGRPLFIIDIAMPRDVEAGVGGTRQVVLTTSTTAVDRERDLSRRSTRSRAPS